MAVSLQQANKYIWAGGLFEEIWWVYVWVLFYNFVSISWLNNILFYMIEKLCLK